MISEKQNGCQSAIFYLNPNLTNPMKVEKELNNFGSASDYPIYNS